MLEPQTILNRICECIDDLGLLLDQIYKFPQKQREQYFDRIQNMKNKLLLLKSNFRETHSTSTQKQYKQIYLAMNTLKSDIQQQATLMPVLKQNRESNRFKEIKDIKKNYEEAMKLLLAKDQEIIQLKNLLFQKQQLIKINFQELTNIKRDHQILIQANRLSKYDQTSVQLQYQALKAALLREQSQIIELREREEEKDRAFNSAIAQLQELKSDLITTKQKLSYYEHIAEVNFAKTLLAQESIKKVEKEAHGLNQNYKLKEYDNFKKLKQIGQLQLELRGKNQLVWQLQQQAKRYKEDLQVMQNQLNRVQKNNQQIHRNLKQESQQWQIQKRSLQEDIQNAALRENQLKKLIQESDKKYLLTIGKLNIAEQLKVKLKQVQCRNELVQEKNMRLQNCIQECHSQIEAKQRQKQSILMRLEKELDNLREYQIQIFRLKQKLKSKEQERIKAINELQTYQNRAKDYQRLKMMYQVREKQKQSEIREEKTKIIKLQQKHKMRDKQIQNLKIKLVRAKIEAIHQIRETIS